LETHETEHKHVEEILQESEEKYRSFVEKFGGIAFRGDKNFKIEFFHGAVNEITGYVEDAFVEDKLKWTDIIHKDDLPWILDDVKRVIFEKLPSSEREYRIISKDKKVKWVVERVNIVFDSSGQVIGSQGTVHDITERKKAEEALKESEEKLKLSMKSAREGMWEWDFTTDQAYFDDVCLQMLGYRPGEIQKKGEWWWTQWHPDDVAPAKKAVKDYLEGHAENYSVEFRLRNKSGKHVWISSNGVVLRKDKNNKPLYMIGIHQDITERKKAEDALRKSQEDLRNLAAHLQSVREDERKSVAREIHDDVGQNLAALKMDMYMLEKKLPREQKPLIDRMKTMMELTDSTVQTVRRIHEELRPTLLDGLGFVEAIKSYKKEFEDKSEVTCELHIEPESIDLSEERSLAFFRILQESMTNVRLHAGATKVKVSVREKDGKLELIVKDNGIGIVEDQLSKSDSFGLIGIREQVDFLKGEVQIKGMPGKGTTLTLIIPLKTESQD